MSEFDAVTHELGGSADTPLPRPSARILLLDTSDRLLLFHATEVVHGEDPAFWFTPGGALEPGESWEWAARRAPSSRAQSRSPRLTRSPDSRRGNDHDHEKGPRTRTRIREPPA